MKIIDSRSVAFVNDSGNDDLVTLSVMDDYSLQGMVQSDSVFLPYKDLIVKGIANYNSDLSKALYDAYASVYGLYEENIAKNYANPRHIKGLLLREEINMDGYDLIYTKKATVNSYGTDYRLEAQLYGSEDKKTIGNLNDTVMIIYVNDVLKDWSKVIDECFGVEEDKVVGLNKCVRSFCKNVIEELTSVWSDTLTIEELNSLDNTYIKEGIDLRKYGKIRKFKNYTEARHLCITNQLSFKISSGKHTVGKLLVALYEKGYTLKVESKSIFIRQNNCDVARIIYKGDSQWFLDMRKISIIGLYEKDVDDILNIIEDAYGEEVRYKGSNANDLLGLFLGGLYVKNFDFSITMGNFLGLYDMISKESRVIKVKREGIKAIAHVEYNGDLSWDLRIEGRDVFGRYIEDATGILYILDCKLR